MALVPVGQFDTIINVNGTERINTTQSDDQTYNITESLGADIQVNGTTEGSFTQTSDSVYDVSVSASASFDRIEVWTFMIGDDDGSEQASWDVFDGSGSQIDTINLEGPSSGGLDYQQKVYTDQGDISADRTTLNAYATAVNHVVTDSSSVAVNGVSQS